MKEKLVYIRAKSEKVPPLQQRLVRVLFVFMLGALLGFLAKYTDGLVVGLIGTYLGFWITVTTIIAVRSRSPKAAALHAFVFLIAMLLVYYIYSMLLFGFFPKYYFIAWGSIALISPIGGYAVWYAKGNGWIAALCAAFPISLLLVEGYSFFYTLSIPRGFDIILAVLLFIILPANYFQRLRMLPIVTGLFFLIEQIGLLYYLPG
ncbi:DUF6518 family protein [Neobacillus drentensis]|uniref:DUF6518 family protein n=1 Tax=Neobacillus drentensis TaxID=220684 RepID=UPI002FFDE301